MFWDPSISAEIGPHNVLLKRGEFIDEYRGARTVPYKLYYPDQTEQKIPLIIWSHGFGGNRDGAAFLSRYLTSYGYGILHLTHDGTDSSLWEGKDGHPWDNLRKARVSRETTLNRFKDVPFALGAFSEWQAGQDNVALNKLDLNSLGMSGHSFGALTTQVMAGQSVPDENDDLIRLFEPRFKAGVLYSPVPVAHLIKDEKKELSTYRSIERPLLHMTGTDDSSPLEDFDYTRRFRVFDHAGHPDQYMLVKQNGDHMVYNGTRGKLEKNPLRETHEEIIQITALAFWDAYLKDDHNARAWLDGYEVQGYLGEKAEFWKKD